MKKVCSIILSICSLFFISGCVKYDVTMKIDKDKSMEVEVICAIDEEAMSSMMSGFGSSITNDDGNDDDYDNDNDNDFSTPSDDMDYLTDSTLNSSMSDTSEQQAALEKRGYKVKEYKEGSYNGIKATLEIDNIDNVSVEKELKVKLSDIVEEDFNDKEFFTVKKGFFKNVYTANFIYEADNEETSSTSMGSMINADLKYNIELPVKSISNNATSTSENKLTWDINMDKDTKINFSFEMVNTTNVIIAVVGGIALLLVVIIILVVVVLSNKKKKQTPSATTMNYQQPVQQPTIKETTPIQNVEPTKVIRRCPNCNVEVEDDAKFCLNCGKQL